MTLPDGRTAGPRRRRTLPRSLSALVAGVIVLAGSAPFSVTGAAAAVWAHAPAGSPSAATIQAAGSIHPTIQYEEARTHAADRIAFAPGDRVKLGYTPRRSDRWAVGDGTSRALPAGRSSGAAMRIAPGPVDQAPGVVPAEPAPSDAPAQDPTPPADAPIVDPGAVIPAEPAAAVDPGGLRREVFGFLPYWELTDSSTRLDWETLSTIAYFGVGATATGDLLKVNADGSAAIGWSGWTSSKMTAVIESAHANRTRVVLTVQSFAWTSSQVASQKGLLASPANRLNLARQVAAAVRDRGADGVNLDFEPIASGYSDEFTALVRTIRVELDRLARGYQLTFDTTGWIGNYPIEAATASGGADAVVVMGYDYRTAGSSPVGSVAPIGGPAYDVGDTVRAYVARVPASKLILGVPYYGRAWSTDTATVHARNISGTKYGASAAVVYATARQYAVDHGRRWDATEGVAWTVYKRQNCTTTYGCVTPWRQLYYDDAKALGLKYDLVNQYGLRGVGLWALGYDGTRPELAAVLKDKFITDTIPPVISAATLSTAAFSPNGDGRLDTVTLTLAVTGLIRYGWLFEPFTGGVAGPPIRSGDKLGSTVSVTWNGQRPDGSTVPDGVYRMTIWAADASDNRATVSKVVTVDTHAPAITSTVAPAWFSPDGDGRSDSTSLRMTSDAPITGAAKVLDHYGAVVRAFPIRAASAGTWTWDGRDSAGRPVRDAPYRFHVDGVDLAGNPSATDTPVRIDRTIRSVTWAASSFQPRAHRTDRLSLAFIRQAAVTVAIYQGSTLVRQIWTNHPVTAGTYAWTWNGRTASGVLVRPGRYNAVVTARSWIGVSTYTRTVTVSTP